MIELKIDKFKNGKVIFHISWQDKEDYERLKVAPFSLTLSDGKEYCLCSNCYPAYNNGDKYFFVRGWDSSMDNTKIMVTFADFLKIFELVKEYNIILEKVFKVYEIERKM